MLVLDRSADVGGLWDTRSGTPCHGDVRLITSVTTSALDGLSFPCKAPYPTQAETISYLRQYRRDVLGDTPFEFGCNVTEIRHESTFWRLATAEGRTFEALAVVLATGLFWNPRPVVRFPNVRSRRTIHSAAYRPDEVGEGSRVLVVGRGNSSADVALSAVRRGAEVHLLWRHTPWLLPRFVNERPSDQVELDFTDIERHRRGEATQQLIALQATEGRRRVTALTGAAPDGLPFETATILGYELLDELERGDGIQYFDPHSQHEFDVMVQAIGYRSPTMPQVFPDEHSMHATGMFCASEDGLFGVGNVLSEGGGFALQASAAHAVASSVDLYVRYPERSRRLRIASAAWRPDLFWGFRPPRVPPVAPFVFSEAYLDAVDSWRARAESQLATSTSRATGSSSVVRSAHPAGLLHLASFIPLLEEGHDDHDLYLLYEDAGRMAEIAELLVAPYRDAGVTRVVGKETRGFLLGGLCGLALGVGFVPARKSSGYFPGATVSAVSEPDWQGKQPTFRMLKRALTAEDRVLVVDDWYTTGNQCRAVKGLVERLGATFVGASVIVEEGQADLSDLGVFNALLRWDVSLADFRVSPYLLVDGESFEANGG